MSSHSTAWRYLAIIGSSGMSHPRSAKVARKASVAMMSYVGAPCDRWICIFSSAWSKGISSASNLIPGYSPIFLAHSSSIGKR